MATFPEDNAWALQQTGIGLHVRKPDSPDTPPCLAIRLDTTKPDAISYALYAHHNDPANYPLSAKLFILLRLGQYMQSNVLSSLVTKVVSAPGENTFTIYEYFYGARTCARSSNISIKGPEIITADATPDEAVKALTQPETLQQLLRALAISLQRQYATPALAEMENITPVLTPSQLEIATPENTPAAAKSDTTNPVTANPDTIDPDTNNAVARDVPSPSAPASTTLSPLASQPELPHQQEPQGVTRSRQEESFPARFLALNDMVIRQDINKTELERQLLKLIQSEEKSSNFIASGKEPPVAEPATTTTIHLTERRAVRGGKQQPTFNSLNCFSGRSFTQGEQLRVRAYPLPRDCRISNTLRSRLTYFKPDRTVPYILPSRLIYTADDRKAANISIGDPETKMAGSEQIQESCVTFLKDIPPHQVLLMNYRLK